MKLISAFVILVALAIHSPGQEDPGKASIGMVDVKVYFATNGDANAAGKAGSPLPKAVAERLRKEEKLSFKHYQLLGDDQQPLYRSYENWAEPLKPSDEVMIRFEALSAPTSEHTVLDLELWLGRKKTIKTDVRLRGDKPLFVLGPEWRGGRLIIVVAFSPKSHHGS